MALDRAVGAHDIYSVAQDFAMPVHGTRSRRSAALLSAATILALVGCSVLLKDMMPPDIDGRYSRMLSFIEASDLNERSREEQAQIDAFYNKYFGGANPTTGSSTPKETFASSSEGGEVIAETSQVENGFGQSAGDDTNNSDPTNIEVGKLSDLPYHDGTTVIATRSTTGEKETPKVEDQVNADSSLSDPYSAMPFCLPMPNLSEIKSLPQYKCGESADQPSPRTEFSASSQEEYDGWSLMTKILERMATKFGERVDKERQVEQLLASTALSTGLRGTTVSSDGSASRKRPIIFLGDGIFESYLGTIYGQPSASSEQETIVQHFASTFSTARYTPLVQAIEGDMTQHLLHRLNNGAIHPAYVSDTTAIYVVLIGTANLSAGHLPQETARGILAVVQQLMDQVKGQVLLLQPLPRGDASTTLSKLCPKPFEGPRCDKEGQPLVAYKPDLEKVRYALENAMATLTHRYPSRIYMLPKCAQAFWPTEEGRARGEEVNYELMMKDGWRPNAKGHEAIGRCLLDCIEKGTC